MSKRANPFTEDFVQRSKVYVDMKQINNTEERLQHVYKKTLNLLYEGAKKTSPPTHEDVNTRTVPSEMRRDNMKQLVINNDGTLKDAGTVIITAKLERPNICKCGTFVCESSCAYCEVNMCATCSSECNVCKLPYCSQCLLTGYDVDVCISCYR